MKLEIVCEDSKYLPTYANETDACMDLKIRVERDNIINPGESKVFGTGIKMKIPEDYFIAVYPRSSTGFNLSCMLANTVGIIDSGYRDEIKVKLFNFGKDSINLEDGQRIAQFMLLPRPKIDLSLVPDDLNFREDDRGGGIGSTGI